MQYAHALNFKSDHGQEHHVEEKKPEHTFNEDADKMVKSVKLAMENGEGCRVSISRPVFVHLFILIWGAHSVVLSTNLCLHFCRCMVH
jgi:hypothetical protein